MKPLKDAFQIRIEEDGTITIVSGKMGLEIHKTAEEFLDQVQSILKAERCTNPLEHKHGHVHVHTSTNAHQKLRS